MIYTKRTTNLNAVTESPYPIGLEGALMVVYENQLNYNALMKAVGISELRYYQETGKDLFVHEAGAFKDLISKVKAFFKEIIKKLKGMFKSFVAAITSNSTTDRAFINKYGKELKEKDISGMKFNGYKFDALNENSDLSHDKYIKLTNSIKNVESVAIIDDIDAEIKKQRGDLINKDPLSESDFRNELKKKYYGEKEDLTFTTCDAYLSIIRDNKMFISKAQYNLEKITNNLENYIAALDNLEKKGTDADGKEVDYTKQINDNITVAKSLADDYTVAFGVYTKALIDSCKQAKAICIKALSYNKKTDKDSVSESYIDNIFANVIIR